MCDIEIIIPRRLARNMALCVWRQTPLTIDRIDTDCSLEQLFYVSSLTPARHVVSHCSTRLFSRAVERSSLLPEPADNEPDSVRQLPVCTIFRSALHYPDRDNFAMGATRHIIVCQYKYWLCSISIVLFTQVTAAGTCLLR